MPISIINKIRSFFCLPPLKPKYGPVLDFEYEDNLEDSQILSLYPYNNDNCFCIASDDEIEMMKLF